VLLVRKLRIHIGPILLASGLVLVLFLWQWLESASAGRTLSGSSLPGLIAGIVAAAIILFELLLWPRKRLRRFRLFPTKFWLASHLWLGLATGPLAFVHSGYRFGGMFTTILTFLLLFVIASGVYGWCMQVLIPKWMLGNLPFETIASQIDDVSLQTVLDARRMLTVAYGPKPEGLARLVNLDSVSAVMRGSSMERDSEGNVRQIIVGAIQRRGDQRALLDVGEETELPASDGREIWRQYASVIEPFLLRGTSLPGTEPSTQAQLASPLNTLQKANNWFGLLQDSCSPSAVSVVNRLKKMCEQRHQFDLQRRAQNWLHGWIAFHAGVSVMLGILLITHIVLALKYM
jgi:hypothetical protein